MGIWGKISGYFFGLDTSNPKIQTVLKQYTGVSTDRGEEGGPRKLNFHECWA